LKAKDVRLVIDKEFNDVIPYLIIWDEHIVVGQITHIVGHNMKGLPLWEVLSGKLHLYRSPDYVPTDQYNNERKQKVNTQPDQPKKCKKKINQQEIWIDQPEKCKEPDPFRTDIQAQIRKQKA
jgi:hypothetical protein